MSTNPVGGVRVRLIKDAVYTVINSGLTSLGWFNGGRQHAPLSIRTEAVKPDEEVPMNTISIEDANITGLDAELGSFEMENRMDYFIDFYAESDALGTHVINDIKDILRGKITVLGRSTTAIPVYDVSNATPHIIFYVDVDSVRVDRAHQFTHPWQEHWYSISLVLTDYYGSDLDGTL